MLAREAQLWASLQHPNVLPFLGIYTDSVNTYLVSEFMSLGNLGDFASSRIAWLDEPVNTRGDLPLYKKYRERDIVSGHELLLILDALHNKYAHVGLRDHSGPRVYAFQGIRSRRPQRCKRPS